jgi:hypothetical protein
MARTAGRGDWVTVTIMKIMNKIKDDSWKKKQKKVYEFG